MSESDMNNSSETNWEQVDQQTDDTIDTSDIPPLTDSFFSRAKLRMPLKLIEATIRMDEEVLEWFKAQGDQYEQLINAALRLYVEVHKAYRS